MNVLVLGSGGREHALAWKIRQSPKCGKIFIAPGNGGTSEVGTNLPIDLKDHDAIKRLIQNNAIDLVIIGPEDPLVNGLADDLRNDSELKKVGVIGPGREGAKLEGSKEFSKQFMEKYGIPTAAAKVFTAATFEEGLKYLESLEPPFVLKADGLAAGKGVIITSDLDEAKATLKELIIDKRFGDSSSSVLIEQFLLGIEVSFFVLTDGDTYRILPEAKDYKRIGEGDKGPNTGGMGAVSPVIFADRIFKEKVQHSIIAPTIEGLKKEGIDFMGFLFIGVISVKGEPYVIEYNVRMGDPETQVVMPRIKTDFLELLIATAEGTLIDTDIEYERYTANAVVCVSEGYPDNYPMGIRIENSRPKGVLTFHAGTKMEDGQLVTNGGRVLVVTALGKNLGEAISKSMKAAEEIEYKGKNYRSDIGMDLKQLGQ